MIHRVYYETRLIAKEPELGPQLVFTLSETKRLVLVISRNSKTASFGVSIEPKLSTLNVKQL
jgi:hypothetical protein